MPNIAKMLKEEFKRLARHEIKVAITSLRKENSALKRNVAELKHRVASMESLNKRSDAKVNTGLKGVEVAQDKIESARITAKMIRSIRGRLGLSQNAFAKLAGVSSQAVYQWERAAGRLKFRGNTKARIISIRRMGKKGAIQLLAHSDSVNG